VLGNRVLNEGTPTVIASFGRAGSSLMTESCVRALAKHGSMYGALERLFGLDHLPAWNVREVRPVNWVYKTHAFLDAAMTPAARSVFIFTDLSRSVASHIRMLREAEPAWRAAHLEHFGLSAMPALDTLSIFRAFDIAGRFHSWFAQSTHAVAFVRLDGLWEAQEKLSAFLGYEVRIVEPPRPHAAQPPEVPSDDAYRGFAELLDSLPPFFTRNA
jgi:hypothetical protein